MRAEIMPRIRNVRTDWEKPCFWQLVSYQFSCRYKCFVAFVSQHLSVYILISLAELTMISKTSQNFCISCYIKTSSEGCLHVKCCLWVWKFVNTSSSAPPPPTPHPQFAQKVCVTERSQPVATAEGSQVWCQMIWNLCWFNSLCYVFLCQTGSWELLELLWLEFCTGYAHHSVIYCD